MVKITNRVFVFILCFFLIGCTKNKEITSSDENNLQKIESEETPSTIPNSLDGIDIDKFLSGIEDLKKMLKENYSDKGIDYIKIYLYNGDIIIEPLDVVKNEKGEFQQTFSIGKNYKEYLYYNEMSWISIGFNTPIVENSILDYAIKNEVIEEDDPLYSKIIEKNTFEKEKEWLYQIVNDENVIYNDLDGITVLSPFE